MFKKITILVVMISILAFAAGSFFMPRNAQAVNQQRVLFNLTSDELVVSAMPLRTATMILDQGGQVVVLLNIKAVRLASTTIPQNIHSGIGAPLQAKLTEIIQKGGRVLVCPNCMANQGVTVQELIPAAETLNQMQGETFTDILTDPNTNIISY